MTDDADSGDREARARAIAARIAAHTSWAMTIDREARTQPARAAFLARFERQVDPEGRLSPSERGLRAQSAKRAYFQAMAMKSVRARRSR